MDDGENGEFTPVPERDTLSKGWLVVRQPDRRKLLLINLADPNELNSLGDFPEYSDLTNELDESVRVRKTPVTAGILMWIFHRLP